MQPVTVMNLVDSLVFGGTERMAINIVNHLPRDRFRSVLCTTRGDGAQAGLVEPHVMRLRLQRRTLLDNFSELRTLVRFIEENDVRILHAHSSAIFISRLASAISKRTALIWHAHWGSVALENRQAWPYRVATLGVDAAIAVNNDLEAWIRRRFRIQSDRIWYLPNIASVPSSDGKARLQLPGVPGKRIVCVANIRPEKDHLTLLRAMAILRNRHPAAHLILVGVPLIQDSVERMKRELDALNLHSHVSYLGPRDDAQDIMQRCDIGVLSSVSEGLPVALLEYGMANLAVIATPAGQSAEVIGSGKAGLLVPSGSPELLAQAFDQFLCNPSVMKECSRTFHERVNSRYGPQVVVEQLARIYDSVLPQ
jgi:glycosyltransferase involved in cell wall biosynthesis